MTSKFGELTLNLNQLVSVKLTPYGVSVLKKHHENEMLQIPLQRRYDLSLHYEKDGTVIIRNTLWELMSIFGTNCFNGAENVFVDNNITYNEYEQPKYKKSIIRRLLQAGYDGVVCTVSNDLEAIEDIHSHFSDKVHTVSINCVRRENVNDEIYIDNTQNEWKYAKPIAPYKIASCGHLTEDKCDLYIKQLESLYANNI